MAATNIFYRLPAQRGTRVASIAGTVCTLDQFCDHILDTEGLNRRDFIVASGTKIFRPSSCNLQSISLQNNSNLDILIPLLGGKGGFGSLLRAIGAQIEKTTNRDACRDLMGRRLRDVKREEELKKLIELKATFEKERKRRKKEKLEKLKKNSEMSKKRTSIQELVHLFDDHAFNKRRLELSDIIDAAVEKGLINSKKRQINQAKQEKNKRDILNKTASDSGPKSGEVCPMETKQVGSDEYNNSSVDHNSPLLHKETEMSSKLDRPNGQSLKKNDLWLGLDDEEELDDAERDNETKESEKDGTTSAYVVGV